MANNHSFYTEAKKSFEARDSFSLKNLSKKIRKYSKWGLYAFLTMTTLWGCANQFRHSTSQSVTQGIEFYQSYDSVFPNLYWGIQTPLTYQVVGDKDEGVDSNGNSIGTKELKPLEFYSINPNYHNNNEDLSEDVDTTSLIILNSEVQNINGTKTNKTFSYTTSYLWGQNPLLKYDWTNPVDSSEYYLEETSEFNQKFITPWTPSDLSFETKKYILENELLSLSTDKVDKYLEDDNISNYEFYEALQLNGNITVDEFNLLIETVTDSEGNDTEVSKQKTDAYLIPDYNSTTNEFNVVEGISELTSENFDELSEEEIFKIANNQMIYLANQIAFLTENEIDINNTQISFFDNLTIKDKVVESFLDEGYIIDGSLIDPYVVSFDSLKASTYTNGVMQKGVGYTVIPQEKISPLYPSKKAIDELEQARSDAWENAGTTYEEEMSSTLAGSSERTNVTGWAVLTKQKNSDGDYRWDNIKLTDKNSNVETPFFSKTKEDMNASLRDATYGEYGTPSDLKYSVELEDYNDIEFSIGTSVERYSDLSSSNTNLSTDFIGMVGKNDLSSIYFSSGSIPKTTLPSYEVTSNNGETKIEEESKFNYVLSESGQSSSNSSRDVFTSSMNDWGDSWNPDFGPMYGMFVWPLAQLSLWVQSWFDGINIGETYHINAWTVLMGIFIIVFSLRGLGVLMSMGSHKNQHKMQEVQTQIAEIKAKYSVYDKSNKQMKQKQQQEIMALYRKHDINPFSSIGTIFITMPIFLSLWTIISAIPAYKIVSVGNFSFGVSAFTGMFNISGLFFTYLFVGIAVGMAQGISSKLPTWLANKRKNIKKIDEATKEAQKKQNKTQNILVGVFIFMGLTVQVLLAIYWIFSAMFTILNELVRHWIKEYKSNKIKE